MTLEDWVPQSCTLPTVERPLRVAEFDQLFADGLRGFERQAPTELLMVLDPTVEAAARDLAERETSCCSFFQFTFAPLNDALQLRVTVPAEHSAVLDALVERL